MADCAPAGAPRPVRREPHRRNGRAAAQRAARIELVVRQQGLADQREPAARPVPGPAQPQQPGPIGQGFIGPAPAPIGFVPLADIGREDGVAGFHFSFWQPVWPFWVGIFGTLSYFVLSLVLFGHLARSGVNLTLLRVLVYACAPLGILVGTLALGVFKYHVVFDGWVPDAHGEERPLAVAQRDVRFAARYCYVKFYFEDLTQLWRWGSRRRLISAELFAHICDAKNARLWGSTDSIVMDRLIDYGAKFNEVNHSRYLTFVGHTIVYDTAMTAFIFYKERSWGYLFNRWHHPFVPSPVMQTN